MAWSAVSNAALKSNISNNDISDSLVEALTYVRTSFHRNVHAGIAGTVDVEINIFVLL